MEEIAAHVSETERTAADAENESRRLKELEFLDIQSKKPNAPSMRAVVFDVRRMGIFVELEEFLIKGLVHRSILEDHGLRFDHVLQHFTDSRGRHTLKVGTELDVRVTRVDFDRLRVDFAPIAIERSAPRRHKSRR